MRKKKMVLYIVLATLLIGCTGKDNTNISMKQKDKAPESLQKLNETLDNILNLAGEIEKIDLDIDLHDKEEAGEEKDNKNKEDTKSNNEEGKEKTDEENNKEQNKEKSNQDNVGIPSQVEKITKEEKALSKPEKLTKVWAEMDKNLENIHSLWNTYEVDGVKKGGSSEKGNEVEASINKMTKAIENRNIIDIYDYGSQAFLNLKPFWDLYTDDYGGDIAEIKYGVYQYYLRAVNNDKKAALKAIDGKDENINRIRLKIGEDEKKIKELDKVTYGLKNLVNSLNEDSRRLYIIKKDNLIKNLKSLENG